MKRFAFVVATFALFVVAAHAQQPAEALQIWQQTPLEFPGRPSAPPPPKPVEITQRNGPTATLYRSLRSVSLDSSKAFHVREAVLDRGELHLYLIDGTIAFTQTVEGRVTGAYFEGEGEVLMRPPNITEHASLGLFSGLGMLDEHFSAAYLRFNTDIPGDLAPFLRETDEQSDFVSSHTRLCHDLAELDGLRLLESFMEDESLGKQDRFFHARLATRLGSLDVYDDSLQEDQFTVARASRSGDNDYIDVWMAFPGREAKAVGDHRVIDPARSAASVPVTAFRIESVVTPPEMLRATADLDIEVKNGGQRLLTFELSRWLLVSKVSVDDVEVEYLQNEAVTGSELARIGNDLISVVMPRPLQAGEHHRLRLTYSGAVMQQAAPGLLYVGARGTWYPNRGMQMSRFDLRFRWPKEWTLVATGQQVSSQTDGPDRIASWTSEQNIPLAGFNLGKFIRSTSKAGQPVVASYTAGVVEPSLASASPVLASESPARNAAIAERSAEAIQKYASWFGPYPFKSLSFTQMPGPLSQGWPTLVYLSSFAYLSDSERQALKLNTIQRLVYGGFMEDHETAHQWWGGQVGWKGYRDQWLMEALANFSAFMIMEQTNPSEARQLLDSYRRELLATNDAGKSFADAGPVTLGYRLSSSVFPNAYIPVTYGRGLWLMCMLRDYFADYERLENSTGPAQDRFLAALREFARRYSRTTATTDDFEKVLEEFLPPKARYEHARSLQWFFDEWVRGSSVPRIEIKKLTFAPRGQSRMATFILTQEQCPDSLITSVPVFAELATGATVPVQRVFADGNQTRIQLRVPRNTRRLLVDPEKKLLRLY